MYPCIHVPLSTATRILNCNNVVSNQSESRRDGNLDIKNAITRQIRRYMLIEMYVITEFLLQCCMDMWRISILTNRLVCEPVLTISV